MLSSQMVNLVFLHLHSPLHFIFDLFFYFSIFKNIELGLVMVMSHKMYRGT